MAISVRVQNKFQIIVPVRVDRAVQGVAPVIDAPDVDDRGWVNNRASGLNVDNARGSLFGMTVGDTVRLSVVREDIDIDPNIPLFVTVSGDQASIATAGGGPLPVPDGTFSVTAVADTTVGTKIEVRLGSVIGPVICEADAHVFSPLVFKITPHICTIHNSSTAATGTGTKPQVNGADLDGTILGTIFDIVRAIWRPAGVTLNVEPAQDEVFTGFLRDGFASRSRAGVSEEDIVMGRNPVANRCNVYFLPLMDRSVGVGVRRETQSRGEITHSGILIGVQGRADATGTTVTNRPSSGKDLIFAIGNDVAHEMGHFLTLPHADNGNALPATPFGRTDTYCRRQLMHPLEPLPSFNGDATATSVPREVSVGYGVADDGREHRGCLITLKDHPQHATDGEVMVARRRFRSPNLYK